MVFDVLETDGIWDKVLGLGESPPYSEEYEQMGYEVSYFIINMGSPFVIALVYLLFMLLVYLLTKLPIEWSKPRKIYRSMASKLFFDQILTFLDSLQLIMIISSFIAIW